jgi:hypothetical protein
VVTSADGSPIEGAGEKYTTPLTMRIGHHQEEISWEIGKLEKGIDGYLPIEWLTKHNPEIDWETGVLRWRSDFCKSHCLPLSMRDAVRNFVKLLREAKVWETEADAKPGGKVAGADNYREWASSASRTTRSMTIALSWSRVRCHHSGRFTLSRRKSCKHSENTSEKNLRPAKSGGPNLRPARQLSLFQSPMVACDYA